MPTSLNLKFKKESQNEIYIEESKEIESSIFSNTFNNGFDNLLEILNEKESKEKLKEESTEEINNIIAFIGERGSGKSSCMASFANFITNEIEKEDVEVFKNEKRKLIRDYKFTSFKTVDPSIFEIGHHTFSWL